MKKFLISAFVFLPAAFLSVIFLPVTTIAAPHLPLDMDGAEYRHVLQQHQVHQKPPADPQHPSHPMNWWENPQQLPHKEKQQPSDDQRWWDWDWDMYLGWLWSSYSDLNHIIQFGERNLDWLNHINSRRDEKLSFSNPQNRRTYPMDAPHIYNEAIVIKNYDDLVSELPPAMRAVLVDGEPFTDEPPVTVEEYLRFGLKADYVYQGVARWIMMKSSLWYLSGVRKYDIRGYYFLSALPNRDEKLRNLNALPEAEKLQIKTWLLGICYNSLVSDRKCNKRLQEVFTEKSGDATEFFAQFFSRSQEMYNAFFRIPDWARRSDIQWSAADVNTATVPFLDNVSDAVKEFLHNIELEFQWQDWRLLLNYVKEGNVPYIEFEPGVTPHVNELGGNQIVMDANSPLTEWDVQWTIRHEFGHVLGFPDCYVEFYDTNIEAIVNYQIDVTNLMCSRRGQMQERHFLEMQRNYFRQ